MGVGVFEEKFDGFGGTFIIDQTYFDDEKYKEYIEECAENNMVYAIQEEDSDEWVFITADGTKSEKAFKSEIDALIAGLDTTNDVVVPQDMWAEDSAINEFEEIATTLVLRDIGFSVEPRNKGVMSGMDLDKEIGAISSDDLFQIGIRSWETDYVIAVAPTSRLHEAIEDDRELISRYKRAPTAFKEEVEKIAGILMDIARAELFKGGHQARYKTSGYTTSRYSDLDGVENIDAHIEGLRDAYRKAIKRTFRDPEYLKERVFEERLEIAAFAYENKGDGMKVKIPFYNSTRDSFLLYCPFEQRMVASLKLDAELDREALKTEPDTGFDDDGHAIHPVTGDVALDVVKALIKNDERKPEHMRFNSVFVPVDEWVGITCEDVVAFDEGSPEEGDVLFEHKAPTRKVKP